MWRILDILSPSSARCSLSISWHRLKYFVRLTNANNIELETALQELLLDLGGDAVETDVALGKDTLCGLSLGLLGSGVGHVGGIWGCFNGVSGSGGFGSALLAASIGRLYGLTRVAVGGWRRQWVGVRGESREMQCASEVCNGLKRGVGDVVGVVV
jgi:hypothetical protein